MPVGDYPGRAVSAQRRAGTPVFHAGAAPALDARSKARVPEKPAPNPVTELRSVDNGAVNAAAQNPRGATGEVSRTGAPDGAGVAAARRKTRQRVDTGRRSAKRQDLRAAIARPRHGEVRDVLGDGEIKISPRRAAPAK